MIQSCYLSLPKSPGRARHLRKGISRHFLIHFRMIEVSQISQISNPVANNLKGNKHKTLSLNRKYQSNPLIAVGFSSLESTF